MIRTTNTGGDSFGVRGSRSSNQARLSSIHSTPASAPYLSNADAIESVNSNNFTATLGVFTSCLDFTGVDAVSAGSGCATINAHTSNAKFNNAEPAWTIAGIGAATITDLNP
jgi:hypothetical protein